MEKKKLVFIIPSLEAGGAQKVLSILLKHLPASHLDITLCVLTDTGVFYDDVPPTINKVNFGLERVRFAALPIYRYLRKSRPDLVFVFDVNHLNLFIGPLSLLLPSKIKYVTREALVLSLMVRNYPAHWILTQLYKICFRRFDRVISQSQYMRTDLIDHFSVPPEKITVINNPIETNLFRELVPGRTAGASAPKLKMIAVGRIVYIKGYDFLLKALSLVKRKDFHLTILGDKTPENPGYSEQVQEMVKELGLNDRVSFLGFNANPRMMINQSDLLVIASRTEAFSNVAIESNALGIPVLAFNSPGGMSEIIVNGFNGWLIENGNIEKLASAIDEFDPLASDKTAIKEYTLKKYALEKVIPEYEKVISDLLLEA